MTQENEILKNTERSRRRRRYWLWMLVFALSTYLIEGLIAIVICATSDFWTPYSTGEVMINTGIGGTILFVFVLFIVLYSGGIYRPNWNPNPQVKDLAADEVRYKEIVIGMIAAYILISLTGYLVIVLAIS